MKILPSLFAGAAALTLAACAAAQAQSPVTDSTPPAQNSATDALKAFPAAAAGQTRHVITLPAQTDESALKVELILGKTQTVDCNRQVFGGRWRPARPRAGAMTITSCRPWGTPPAR